MRFQNSTLIVTGGASGIGRATIERALAEGAAVLAVDRDADALRTLKDTFKDAALEVLSGDVADADLAAKGVEIAQGMGSALKGVVTAAGISKSGQTIQGVSAEDWDEVFRVNVRGSWTWLKAALPAFEAGDGGSVVFLASQLAFGGGVHERILYREQGCDCLPGESRRFGTGPRQRPRQRRRPRCHRHPHAPPQHEPSPRRTIRPRPLPRPPRHGPLRRSPRNRQPHPVPTFR